MNKETIGTAGWIGLTAYVVAFDVLAPETLSSAMDRYLEDDKTKYIAWAVGGVVTAHLFNLIPPEYDILQKTSDYVGGRVRSLYGGHEE